MCPYTDPPRHPFNCCTFSSAEMVGMSVIHKAVSYTALLSDDHL